jgi:hypothetical protein
VVTFIQLCALFGWNFVTVELWCTEWSEHVKLWSECLRNSSFYYYYYYYYYYYSIIVCEFAWRR